MIINFTHKGLRELFQRGSTTKLSQEHIKRIIRILGIIHAATEVRDLNVPGLRLHELKKPPYRGFWSLDVSGNYRIIFRFENGKASDLDYLDTH